LPIVFGVGVNLFGALSSIMIESTFKPVSLNSGWFSLTTISPCDIISGILGFSHLLFTILKKEGEGKFRNLGY
jgi:hypothetical protein